MTTTTREPPGRNVAEWVTFGASCAVLAGVLALIAVQLPNSDDPAAPVARAESVHTRAGSHHVEVIVVNDGDEPAANVQVRASLAIGEQTTEGDQTIDFLAADEEARLTFVFVDDPALGELTVAVTGFADP